MRCGEQVELQSGTGLDPVWREMACDEDWCRILSHLLRSGRSPVRGTRLVVR
jgi:hypothetical protein